MTGAVQLHAVVGGVNGLIGADIGDAIDIRAIADEIRRLGERAGGGRRDQIGRARPKPDNGQRASHNCLPRPGIRIIEK